MHRDSILSELAVQCYFCECRNVFNLGLIPSKTESTLIFLCRAPCLMRNLVNEKEYDTTVWQPLIEEKTILPWLVNAPTPEEDKMARKITFKEICTLEDKMKGGTLGTPNEIAPKRVRKIRLVYNGPEEYRTIYKRLVDLEEEESRELKKSQKKTNVLVHWNYCGEQLRVKFFFSSEDTGTRVLLGDEIKLKSETVIWKGVGNIIEISDADQLTMVLTSCTGRVPSQRTACTIKFTWRPTIFYRMKKGLKLFVYDECDAHIKQRVLGKETEDLFAQPKQDILSAPNLPTLNSYQQEAVRKSLSCKLQLIQGPPGTGKTVTSATIIYNLVKYSSQKVLVAAPSNIAIDQLTEKIHQCGLKVVRIAAKSREALSSKIDFLTLHEQVKTLTLPKFATLQSLMRKLEACKLLNEQESKVFSKLKAEAEQLILDKAEVVCCTCLGTFDLRLKQFSFGQILIDEATQATEPECLLPILKGAHRVILVGDHCQLGPVVMCRKAADAGLSRSLFERLVQLGNRPLRLHLQYRMHPAISEFPSNTFYEGTLQNGIAAEERHLQGLKFPWPVPGTPTFFYNIEGAEELTGTGTTYLNRSEARGIERLVSCLLNAGIAASQIGIITPYEGQRLYISRSFLNSEYFSEQIEISSVDSFQGREKEFILLSCVRSNECLGIGFLNDPRRLNVALTRAKYGLVICGNAAVLSKSKVWRNLLNHYNEHGLLVEGPLNNLTQCNVQLGASRKINMEMDHRYVDHVSGLGTFAEPASSDFLGNL